MGFDDLSDSPDSQEIVDPKLKAQRAKPKALKAIHTMEKLLQSLDATELKRHYGKNEFLDEDDIRGM